MNISGSNTTSSRRAVTMVESDSRYAFQMHSDEHGNHTTPFDAARFVHELHRQHGNNGHWYRSQPTPPPPPPPTPLPFSYQQCLTFQESSNSGFFTLTHRSSDLGTTPYNYASWEARDEPQGRRQSFPAVAGERWHPSSHMQKMSTKKPLAQTVASHLHPSDLEASRRVIKKQKPDSQLLVAENDRSAPEAVLLKGKGHGMLNKREYLDTHHRGGSQVQDGRQKPSFKDAKPYIEHGDAVGPKIGLAVGNDVGLNDGVTVIPWVPLDTYDNIAGRISGSGKPSYIWTNTEFAAWVDGIPSPEIKDYLWRQKPSFKDAKPYIEHGDAVGPKIGLAVGNDVGLNDGVTVIPLVPLDTYDNIAGRISGSGKPSFNWTNTEFAAWVDGIPSPEIKDYLCSLESCAPADDGDVAEVCVPNSLPPTIASVLEDIPTWDPFEDVEAAERSWPNIGLESKFIIINYKRRRQSKEP